MLRTKASQRIDAVNIHGATAADSLSAASSKGECRIDLVLDSNQSVQHHWPRFVQIESV